MIRLMIELYYIIKSLCNGINVNILKQVMLLRRCILSFLLFAIYSCETAKLNYVIDDNYDNNKIVYDDNSVTEIERGPYYYHFAPNSFIKDGYNKKAIASESIEDIELSARLGFKLIEANIHQTSDGHFVCIHGKNGTFGPEVKSIDSCVISTNSLRNTKIGSVSLGWIKKYVRYDSDYEQYQTSIPSLEEFCIACRQNNIGILAGVRGNKKAVEICQKYLAGNVVIYGPPSDIRDYFKGYVFTWNNSKGATIESLLKKANYYGPPYICSIGDNIISELASRDELEKFIEVMHSKGYLVGWAAVYSKELDSIKYHRLGMDFSGSGHEVNRFEANLDYYDLKDNSHQPITSGVIFNETLSLSFQDYVTCGSTDWISVGKGYLLIQFKGTIRICFGSLGSSGDRHELTSNGDELIVLSDYFYQRPTTLFIVSLSDKTTISQLVYYTKIC